MKRLSPEQSLRLLQRLWDKRLAPLNAPDAGERLLSVMTQAAKLARVRPRQD